MERLYFFEGKQVSGSFWLDDGDLELTIIPPQEDREPDLLTDAFGGAFRVTFRDTLSMLATSGIFADRIQRMVVSQSEQDTLEHLGDQKSDFSASEIQSMKSYQAFGPIHASPVLRVIASGIEIQEIPLRGY